VRLQKVDHGHTLGQKLKLAFIRLVGRREPYDIIKLLSYRPEMFGAPMNALSQAVLRGPSDWSVGERELFAAFVSRLNQCPF
jgi:hypothetical protein